MLLDQGKNNPSLNQKDITINYRMILFMELIWRWKEGNNKGEKFSNKKQN